MCVIKALHPDGKPIDTRLAVRREIGRIGRAWIRFQGDFGLLGNRQARTNHIQYGLHGLAAKQARGAAANKYGFQAGPVRSLLQFKVQVAL